MATTKTITTNFVGSEATPYIMESFKDAFTIEKGLITIIPNISHGKGYIRRIDGENGLQNYSCSFNATGSIVLDEKVLEPKKLMINQEFCKEDFRNLWDSSSMGFSAFNDSMPTDEKEAILGRILDQLATQIDSFIWTGNGATAGQFAGLLPKLELDADVIDIDAAATITPANIVAELGKVFIGIPDAIFTKEDLVMVVSSDMYRAYIASQAALGFANQYQNQDNPVLYFNGVAMQVVPTLPAKTAVAYLKSNFYLGTALQADFNEVRVLDMTDQDLSDNVRVKVVFAADTNYGFGGEVVLYNPA
jgi:hypothetical protein